MIIKTRIFEFFDGNYRNLSELAQNMGISVSQIYRVREGTRSINQGFIVGAIRAFPQYRLDELFYLVVEPGNGESGKETQAATNPEPASTRVAPAGGRYACGV